MDINVKTKIQFNGREYSSSDELPPEARAAHRKAAFAGTTSLNRCLDKITLRRRKMRRRGREYGLDDDIMNVVENNGEVTLPTSTAAFPSSRQIKMLLALLGALAIAAIAVAARTAG